ncbi:MAG: hypothetical protein ACLP36_12970, partial [Acidimicrobiales bacterium]
MSPRSTRRGVVLISRWLVAFAEAFLLVLALAVPAAASSVIVISSAGSGNAAFWGDGGLASSTTVNLPIGVAVDSAGDVF